jgi:FMN reductase (NADPH)
VNETIELLMKHKSIRKFTKQPVSKEQLEQIIAAAQMASSSSNVQAYSIIQVVDKDRRQKLAAMAGNQGYVEDCPIFLVWCADLFRLREAYGLHGDPKGAYIHTTENLVVATVDVALAAQNAAIAAESMGLGIVYIGGIRNQIEQVSELLELPELVYPVFGMCIGYPDQLPVLRPRLPMEAVLHVDKYSSEDYPTAFANYDLETKAYMLKRSAGRLSSGWTEGIHAKLAKPTRLLVNAFLNRQGFEQTEDGQ